MPNERKCPRCGKLHQRKDKYCADCRREYNREYMPRWRVEHAEHAAELSREARRRWRARYPEKNRDQARAYRYRDRSEPLTIKRPITFTVNVWEYPEGRYCFAIESKCGPALSMGNNYPSRGAAWSEALRTWDEIKKRL